METKIEIKFTVNDDGTLNVSSAYENAEATHLLLAISHLIRVYAKETELTTVETLEVIAEIVDTPELLVEVK